MPGSPCRRCMMNTMCLGFLKEIWGLGYLVLNVSWKWKAQTGLLVKLSMYLEARPNKFWQECCSDNSSCLGWATWSVGWLGEVRTWVESETIYPAIRHSCNKTWVPSRQSKNMYIIDNNAFRDVPSPLQHLQMDRQPDGCTDAIKCIIFLLHCL